MHLWEAAACLGSPDVPLVGIRKAKVSSGSKSVALKIMQ